MQSSWRPSISLIPLVRGNNDLPPPGHNSFTSSPMRYHVPRRAIVLSIMFFVVLILLAIFIALFTSFVQAQESAAAAASSAAVSDTPA
ncbi:hypothetical protein BC826DRAFT_1184899 [Russula brevipes]|nr:hypothetical protein BC826DRAFT_1184899 [Russula brevipes]